MPQPDPDLMRCPVCWEEYSNSNPLLTPTLLACGHTFCLDCLRKLCTQDGMRHQITCPEDRSVTSLNASGVEGLPKNVAILRLLGGQSITPAATHGPPCAGHPGNFKDKYCENARCRMLICETCLSNGHMDHDIKTFQDMQQELKAKVTELQLRCQRRMDLIRGRVERVEHHHQKVASTMQMKREEIEKAYKEKEVLLRANKDSLIAKMQSLESGYSTELDVIIARYTQMREDIDNTFASLKPGRLVDLGRGGLDRHEQRCEDLERLLKKPMYEDCAVDITVASETVRFFKTGPETIRLGDIENGDIESATEMPVVRRALRKVGRELGITLSITVVMEVKMKNIEGMTRLTKHSVVVGHGRFQSGAEVVSVTGSRSQFFENDVGTVGDIVILVDGRPVVYDGTHVLGIFNREGSASVDKLEDLPLRPISIHSDQSDSVYVVDGGRMISVFAVGSNNKKRTIVTREAGHQQICVTASGKIITSTGNQEPSRVTVYDKDGVKYNSIVAKEAGEQLYVAMDGEDNVFLARIRDNVVAMSYCKVRDNCLIEWTRYRDLELNYCPRGDWSRWHFVCLSPNLVALARDKRLYFIQM